MANDLQARFTTEMGKALSDMSRMEQRLKNLETASKKLNRTNARMTVPGRGSAYSKFLQQNTKNTRTSTKAAKDLSEALSRLGGPLGGLSGQLASSSGLPAGMARLAAGAALAVVAIQALNKVGEAELDRTRKAIEAQKALTEARKEGTKAIKDQASAGISQEDDIRLLTARGGARALQEADRVQRSGIGAGDARQGVAEAQLLAKDINQRRKLIDAALRLAQTGEVTFPEAIKRLGSRRNLGLISANDDGSGLRRALTGELSDIRGTRVTDQELAATEQRVGSSEFLRQTDLTQGVSTDIDALARQRVVDGSAYAAARSELGEARDPVAAAQSRAYRQLQEQISVLQQLADSQNALSAAIANLTSTEGSYQTQADRSRNAARAAGFAGGD